jgi:hypothetical protein
VPLSSIPSGFQFPQCPVLDHRLPITQYWIRLNDVLRLFLNGPACHFHPPPPTNVMPIRTTGHHTKTVWYYRQNVVCHIREIAMPWLHSIMLTPRLGNSRYPTLIAVFHQVQVVIITIRLNLPQVLGRFRCCIQIELWGCLIACCVIASSTY